MIYKNTQLKIADNTGPKKAKCINISKKKIGYLADLLVIAIKKKFIKRKKIKKNILLSTLITSKKKQKRLDGNFIMFNNNKIVLLDEKLNFLGTNLKSLICKEYKKNKKKNLKLISYSRGNI